MEDTRQPQQQQQHQQQLLTRLPGHRLNARPPPQKYPIGTKVSISDYVHYYQDEDTAVETRLDGVVEGFERTHQFHHHIRGGDDETSTYEWMYVVRFVDNDYVCEDHRRRDEDGEVIVDDDEVAIATYVDTATTTTTTTTPSNNTNTNTNIATTISTFLKFISESEVSESLSEENESYIIDQYFGPNLRETIQMRGKLIRDRRLIPSSYSASESTTNIDWESFFERDLAKYPEIATLRFPLFDETLNIIGDFTVLAMALLVLTMNDKKNDNDNDNDNNGHNSINKCIADNVNVYDDATSVIQKIVDSHPPGVKQGRYHDPAQQRRQGLGGSKYIGILDFLLEPDDDVHVQLHVNTTSTTNNNNDDDDDDDDHADVDVDVKQQQQQQRCCFFGNLIDPDILKTLITSEHGKNLATEFCPRRRNILPINRFLYSAWHKEYYGKRNIYRNDEDMEEEGGDDDNHDHEHDRWHGQHPSSIIIDASILSSPQVRVLLQHDWRAVAFLLCEQFLGTMTYSKEVLDFLVKECVANTANIGPGICFGGYLHKHGGGIVKWFKKYQKENIPNSLIALMFKHLQIRHHDLFRNCLELFVDSQRHLLPGSTSSTSTLPHRHDHNFANTTTDIDTADTTSYSILTEYVLDALAIVQINMVSSPYLSKSGQRRTRSSEVVEKHCKIIGCMWRKFFITFLVNANGNGVVSWNNGGGIAAAAASTNAATGRNNHDGNGGTYNEKSRMIVSSDSSNADVDKCDECDDDPSHRHHHLRHRHRRRPMYTAIRRNHAWRMIVRDIVRLDPTALDSVDSTEFLPPFALAVVEGCARSLVSPIVFDEEENDQNNNNNNKNSVSSTERIYELLRANPAVLAKTGELGRAAQAATAALLQKTKNESTPSKRKGSSIVATSIGENDASSNSLCAIISPELKRVRLLE